MFSFEKHVKHFYCHQRIVRNTFSRMCAWMHSTTFYLARLSPTLMYIHVNSCNIYFVVVFHFQMCAESALSCGPAALLKATHRTHKSRFIYWSRFGSKFWFFFFILSIWFVFVVHIKSCQFCRMFKNILASSFNFHFSAWNNRRFIDTMHVLMYVCVWKREINAMQIQTSVESTYHFRSILIWLPLKCNIIYWYINN